MGILIYIWVYKYCRTIFGFINIAETKTNKKIKTCFCLFELTIIVTVRFKTLEDKKKGNPKGIFFLNFKQGRANSKQGRAILIYTLKKSEKNRHFVSYFFEFSIFLTKHCFVN